jgi:UDP-N-acetylglucosamine 2-epimerase (non-hydrolysing)
MAPVVLALDRSPDIDCKVCVTGQHRQLLDRALQDFSIRPDHDLNVMRDKQDLFDITISILDRIREILRQEKPDVVLVHGDTTTAMSASLAAFYQQIPVGHVEAGLRTGDLLSPFPEEANRQIVGRVAQFHFAPTKKARDNLIAEGVPTDRIWVTGNTVIDALLLAKQKVDAVENRHWQSLFGDRLHHRLSNRDRRHILITGHRRESFGQGFEGICSAIYELAIRNPDFQFTYPVHLNPNVQEPVNRILGGLENVALIKPVEYLPFVWLMSRADVILTDSGGIQEEAPALGKRVLVMRDVTERPEAIEAGTAKLVGTDPARIVAEIEAVLGDASQNADTIRALNPFGDGRASSRIVDILRDNGNADLSRRVA